MPMPLQSVYSAIWYMLCPTPDRGREMKDDIDAGERLFHRHGIAHIAADQLHFRVEIIGARALRSVDLLGKVIERANDVAVPKSSSARWEPTKPAPPVISAFLMHGVAADFAGATSVECRDLHLEALEKLRS